MSATVESIIVILFIRSSFIDCNPPFGIDRVTLYILSPSLDLSLNAAHLSTSHNMLYLHKASTISILTAWASLYGGLHSLYWSMISSLDYLTSQPDISALHHHSSSSVSCNANPHVSWSLPVTLFEHGTQSLRHPSLQNVSVHHYSHSFILTSEYPCLCTTRS